MKGWRPWLVIIVVATVIQIAVVAMLSSEPAPAAGHWQATAPVAVSSLPPLIREGSAVLGAEPAVIYFWATWCEPCVRHLPETLALASGSSRVWLVARDDEWATVVRYFGGDVPAAVVHDTGIGAALGVDVLPTSFYLANGEVRARSLDPLSRALITRPPE